MPHWPQESGLQHIVDGVLTNMAAPWSNRWQILADVNKFTISMSRYGAASVDIAVNWVDQG